MPDLPELGVALFAQTGRRKFFEFGELFGEFRRKVRRRQIVIVLRAADIVPNLADTAAFLRERQSDGRISYTSFITGPSRTADIERVSAIGVHGPLDLHIILLEG